MLSPQLHGEELRKARELWHELMFPLSPLHLRAAWRHLGESPTCVQQWVTQALVSALRQGKEPGPDENPFG